MPTTHKPSEPGPSASVQRIDQEHKQIFGNMTKEQVESAPDYDADRHRADERNYHKEVGAYYEPHLP